MQAKNTGLMIDSHDECCLESMADMSKVVIIKQRHQGLPQEQQHLAQSRYAVLRSRFEQAQKAQASTAKRLSSLSSNQSV